MQLLGTTIFLEEYQFCASEWLVNVSITSRIETNLYSPLRINRSEILYFPGLVK